MKTSTATAHQAIHSSQSEDWYTPAVYIDAARRAMGGIDLDPASCDEANRTIQAAQIHTAETDGLAHEWHGRVWLNPPYGKTGRGSNQGIWSAKLIAEYESGRTTAACLLVNSVTDRAWFRPLWRFWKCFPYQRIRFVAPGGEPGPQPTHGNVIVYMGSDHESFRREFRRFGIIVPPVWDEQDGGQQTQR